MRHQTTILRLAILTITLTLGGSWETCRAGPILIDTGLPSSGSNIPVFRGQLVALSFRLELDAVDVTVEPYLNQVGTPGGMTAYLSTRLGPGTTPEHLIAQNSLDFPRPGYTGGYQPFFSLSSLGAGTYYITVAPSPGQRTDVWTSSLGHPPLTSNVGPWYLDNVSGNLDNPYGNPFRQYNQWGGDAFSLPFRVTGVAAVPEPSTLAIAGLGALGLLSYAWRRRKQPDPPALK